jgi:hypothetical protein
VNEGRYSRYKRRDVWEQLVRIQQNTRLNTTIVSDSIIGSSVSLIRDGKKLRAVVLARASDWYRYSLNCVEEWNHGITAIVCGTHDSCVPVPVLAMDTRRWYEPNVMRTLHGTLAPKLDTNKKLIPDKFDHARKSQYGHNMLIGALMCEKDEAFARLKTFEPSTQRRIRAKLVALGRRRPGHPLVVAPDNS